MPLLTLNRRHFAPIEGLRLVDLEGIDADTFI